jgi:hypothetical protein
MAQRANPRLYEELLGFPSDLPDLRVLRPPGGNLRAEGVEQSCWSQRERGDLPKTY